MLSTETACRLSQILRFSTAVGSELYLYGKDIHKGYSSITENTCLRVEPALYFPLRAVIAASRTSQRVIKAHGQPDFVDRLLVYASLLAHTPKDFLYERKSCSRLHSVKPLVHLAFTARRCILSFLITKHFEGANHCREKSFAMMKSMQ